LTHNVNHQMALTCTYFHLQGIDCLTGGINHMALTYIHIFSPKRLSVSD